MKNSTCVHINWKSAKSFIPVRVPVMLMKEIQKWSFQVRVKFKRFKNKTKQKRTQQTIEDVQCK